MTLILLPAQPWPSQVRWMGDAAFTDLQRGIVLRAHADDGEQETAGPNRSPYIDSLIRWAGLDPASNPPHGIYWCGIAVARWWTDAGAKVPRGYAACDAWLPHAIEFDSVDDIAKHGAAVLYGKRGAGAIGRPWPAMQADGWDASHIGIIAKCTRSVVTPKLPTLTIEGNRGYAGSPTNNGVAVDMAPLSRKDVLGIVLPQRG